MPYYCFMCKDCMEGAEICCSIVQWARLVPNCPKCEKPMERDYAAEQGGRVLGGGTWPKYDTEVIGDDDNPVEVKSFKDWDRKLSERGLTAYTENSDRQYRWKHRQDRWGKGRGYRDQ